MQQLSRWSKLLAVPSKPRTELTLLSKAVWRLLLTEPTTL